MEKIEKIKAFLKKGEKTEAISFVTAQLEEILVAIRSENLDRQQEYKEFLRLLLHFETDMFFEEESIFENRELFKGFEDVIRELFWLLNDSESPTPLSLKDVSERIQKVDIFEFDRI